MTSFARRTLTTTAAAAGVAAIGAGLAGPAFAAPTQPDHVPAASRPAAAHDTQVGRPAAPDQARDVPEPFVFTAPSHDTAAPGTPTAGRHETHQTSRNVGSTPQRTVSHSSSGNSLDTNGNMNGTRISSLDGSPDSAMSRLDTARSMADLLH